MVGGTLAEVGKLGISKIIDALPERDSQAWSAKIVGVNCRFFYLCKMERKSEIVIAMELRMGGTCRALPGGQD